MCFAFLHGFCLAFGLIIPLGVQNIFIFNQGATQDKFRYALPSILTAASCDSLLIILAVFGVSLFVLQVLWLKALILALGFVFLVYVGFATWHTQPQKHDSQKHALSAWQQIVFAASVSILNPHAVIDTVTVIGSNALSYTGYEKVYFAVACVIVSWLWFFGLAFAGHKMYEIDQQGVWLVRINKFSASVIWAVALYIAWQFGGLMYAH